jgi:hypothetical protein
MVAVYLVKPQPLSDVSAVNGQVTEDMPVAEYRFDLLHGPNSVRVTGKRSGAFAIVEPEPDYNSGTPSAAYSCESWNYNAEYEMTFFGGERDCRVVVNLPGAQGAGHFQISRSQYSSPSLMRVEQTVTLSPQNPVVGLTFNATAGEDIELFALKLSGVALDIVAEAPDTYQYASPWDNNGLDIQFSSTMDGDGFVYLMLPKDSQQHVTVQVRLKQVIIEL